MAKCGIILAMKTNLKASLLSLTLLTSLICAAARPCAETLEAGFASPPGSARPHVYYMIMNGNMSKECITDDFEAMAKVGIGGVLVLDVGCFIPAGPVVFASPEWYDIMLHLHKEAKRLEIRVTNLWPNRLIGDEVLCKPDREWVAHPRRGSFEYSIKEIPQWVKDGKPSPTGRRTFTTWRHWTKNDKPLPSGLIGPVIIRFGETAERSATTARPWPCARIQALSSGL